MKVIAAKVIEKIGLEVSAVVDNGMLQARLSLPTRTIGGDGLEATGQLVVSFPVAKIVAPLKEKLVTPIAAKIKDMIPGNFEDNLVDRAASELVDYGVKLLTEEQA